MVELKETGAFDGQLPMTVGAVSLDEADVGFLTSLTPFEDAAGLSGALENAHGVSLPKPNRSTGKDGNRCVWFGRGEAVLMGPAPEAGLAKHGAVVDISDGWAAATLVGAKGEEVLARLVPVDLRSAAFKRGHTVRTQLGHMPTSITRVGADRFLILVFRSMASTLVHELKVAMAAVASRG